ncbi:hypothetical protein V8J82_10540 [Gymnodinialimonas sp. 2305UL16-5]|uniref:hypothetical protein n=1 Tax=Gymnodinialimonas mytili TaxID=3126503 RepID=UPI00309D1346
MVPSPEDILSVEADAVPAFIQSHATAKTLTELVKHLNDDLIGGDETASEMASRALHHLGFVEYA